MAHNIFTNRDGSIDPISFIASGRCILCKKTIAGGMDLMSYHIWKEHHGHHLKTVEKTYNKMDDDFKSRFSLERAKQKAEEYYLNIDKQQKELV